MRRKFFKKILIGSILALQITVTGPVYNTLAVGIAKDKIPTEASIPSNIEVDKELEEAEILAAYQSADDIEIYYTNLIEKYWTYIHDKEKEFESNDEKFEKLNLDLRSDKITEEEKQDLQEKLNNIKKLNEKLINYVVEISKKIDKLLNEKYRILKEVRRAERAEEEKKAKEARRIEKAKKFKEDPEKYYKDLLEKYRIKINIRKKDFEMNEERLKKINLDLRSDTITKEEKQALQLLLNIQKEYRQFIIGDVTKISEKIKKLLVEIRKISEEAKKSKEHNKSEKYEKQYLTENDSN